MNIPKYIFFNFLTKRTVERAEYFSFFGRRVNSMWVDHNFLSALVFPLLIITILPVFFIDLGSFEKNILVGPIASFLPFLLIVFLILNKDMFNARSIAKRHFGYQIVDFETKSPATEIQCVIRNSTILISPLEVFISIINPKRRLGDYIAKTELIITEIENPELIMDEINNSGPIENKSKVVFVSLLISLFVCATAWLPFLWIYYKII